MRVLLEELAVGKAYPEPLAPFRPELSLPKDNEEIIPGRLFPGGWDEEVNDVED